MTVRIVIGDALETLRTLPDESVHCCVTSPPYWGLRDYGVVGQLGLERTPEEYVAKMVEVFAEVRRVLRADGTCWINLGDSYASGGRATWRSGASENKGQDVLNDMPRPAQPDGLKPKDLIGIPWRIAFALQADGWYLRQEIIWSKPNPMPESVRDRCTKAHESLFLMAKSERYYFDQDAILEPVSANTHLRVSQDTLAEQHGSDRVPGKTNGPMKAVVRKLAIPGEGIKNNESMDAALVAPGRPKRSGNKERVAGIERGIPGAPAEGTAGAVASGVPWEGYQRNRRSVWEVATQPFSEAHFATFPPALIEPCILAGCPKGGTVLDPFLGAGTTGLVADRLGRNCIGIELNPAYAEMARKRIHEDAPLFDPTESNRKAAGAQVAPEGIRHPAG